MCVVSLFWVFIIGSCYSAELVEFYSAMTVHELKVLLKERGVPSTGLKKDLVARLVQAETEGRIDLTSVFMFIKLIFYQGLLARARSAPRKWLASARPVGSWCL